MLTIPFYVGSPIRSESGLDSFKNCLNKEHFKHYPKQITYIHNQRGFRDAEWPDDLSDVIWCVGDSFTMGIGQPFEETWPYLLEKKIGKRCLNLGEDGASNDTIALRAQEIYRVYKPKIILIMWSYLWRRRINGTDVMFDPKEVGINHVPDIDNFKINVQKVLDLNTKVIQTTSCKVLDGYNEYPQYREKEVFKSIINPIQQFDFARDYQHFDIITSQKFCDLFKDKINSLGNI